MSSTGAATATQAVKLAAPAARISHAPPSGRTGHATRRSTSRTSTPPMNRAGHARPAATAAAAARSGRVRLGAVIVGPGREAHQRRVRGGPDDRDDRQRDEQHPDGDDEDQRREHVNVAGEADVESVPLVPADDRLRGPGRRPERPGAADTGECAGRPPRQVHLAERVTEAPLGGEPGDEREHERDPAAGMGHHNGRSRALPGPESPTTGAPPVRCAGTGASTRGASAPGVSTAGTSSPGSRGSVESLWVALRRTSSRLPGDGRRDRVRKSMANGRPWTRRIATATPVPRAGHAREPVRCRARWMV